MPQENTALSRIEELKAQIAKLQEDAVKELRQKREALVAELEAIDAQIAELTGKESEKKNGNTTRARRPSITDDELKVKIMEVMAANGKNGMNAKQISGHIDQAPVRISAFIKKNPKVLKRQGTGPATKFFLP